MTSVSKIHLNHTNFTDRVPNNDSFAEKFICLKSTMPEKNARNSRITTFMPFLLTVLVGIKN